MAIPSDIDRILQQSYELLLPKPQWLVLTTVYGHYLAHLVHPNVEIELDRISALAASAEGHHERHAQEHGLGTLKYGVTFADKGFVITAFISTDWVLMLKFGEADLDTLMNILQILPTITNKLAQLASDKDS